MTLLPDRRPPPPAERGTPAEILRRIRHLELRTRRLVESAFGGQYHSAFKGRGMNFDEVREYQPGDEIRTIDWNVTARTGTPHVKKFIEERELSMVLVVDASASGAFGSVHWSKREYAAEIACVLAFSATRNHDKVGLLLFTDGAEHYLPPRKGRQHALRAIRDILYYRPRGRGTDLAGALEFLNRVLARRSLVFLLSDFDADLSGRALAVTARRHDLVALAISDPMEERLPGAGPVMLEDAETGAQVEIDTSSRAVRRAYEEFAARRRRELEQLFGRLAIDSMFLRTDGEYLPALRQFFRTRKMRRAHE